MKFFRIGSLVTMTLVATVSLADTNPFNASGSTNPYVCNITSLTATAAYSACLKNKGGVDNPTLPANHQLDKWVYAGVNKPAAKATLPAHCPKGFSPVEYRAQCGGQTADSGHPNMLPWSLVCGPAGSGATNQCS
jgi:hypothetical protein